MAIVLPVLLIRIHILAIVRASNECLAISTHLNYAPEIIVLTKRSWIPNENKQ